MTDADLLYVYLPGSRDRAEPLGSLAERLGWARRRVEAAVMELRRMGRPVASDGTGIWVTNSADELAETYRSLRHRIEAQSVTAWAVRSTLRRMRSAEVQQETLWGDAA